MLSIRIPRKLKEEMDKLKDAVDWPSEIRAFIEERVRMYRRIRALSEIDRILEELPETPRGLAARLVREDRERH
ncbi:CopG family transcriptional regulator [Hyperthermus butylicus]|uniref:type II toxin-antitoxin system VapB family antitoxin n=1 Tax=Hyperthermus butylicus TaxID=54248 RepID=UPI001E5CD6EC|nr:CopG family transcriptional regulator [Hyperthermus butylicus]